MALIGCVWSQRDIDNACCSASSVVGIGNLFPAMLVYINSLRPENLDEAKQPAHILRAS